MASMLSGDGVEITGEHIGKRIIYTGRNKNQRLGTIRDVAPVSGMVDVDLDDSVRSRFYVPSDTVAFVPDAAVKAIDG